jgi:hypothetical protein
MRRLLARRGWLVVTIAALAMSAILPATVTAASPPIRFTLRYGDTWKRPGIRCTMRTTGLRCRNLDGHGFRLAKGAVRRF